MLTVDLFKLGEFVLVNECQKCFVVDFSSATIAICKAVRVFHDFFLLAPAQLHSQLLASTQTQNLFVRFAPAAESPVDLDARLAATVDRAGRRYAPTASTFSCDFAVLESDCLKLQ